MVGLLAAIASGEAAQLAKWHTIVEQSTAHKMWKTRLPENMQKVCYLWFGSKPASFNASIDGIYEIVGQSLALSMSSSFSRNSALMTQLHIIFDTSSIVSVAMGGGLTEDELERILEERLNNTDLTFDNQWKVLSIHRVG